MLKIKSVFADRFPCDTSWLPLMSHNFRSMLLPSTWSRKKAKTTYNNLKSRLLCCDQRRFSVLRSNRTERKTSFMHTDSPPLHSFVLRSMFFAHFSRDNFNIYYIIWKLKSQTLSRTRGECYVVSFSCAERLECSNSILFIFIHVHTYDIKASECGCCLFCLLRLADIFRNSIVSQFIC